MFLRIVVNFRLTFFQIWGCVQDDAFLFQSFQCFFSSPDTATVSSASYGATDRGELCPFCSLWQWPTQWREPPLWELWQRLLRRSL